MYIMFNRYTKYSTTHVGTQEFELWHKVKVLTVTALTTPLVALIKHYTVYRQY